ncbi:hypothetical protein LEP1GSC021_1268 [Leptospira noguchii str. 1993005606]|uniref:Uncharacterized protein n=2 Tax=Leptospira noguchii TaxID=28182 RepID=M6Y7T9_9LEPT|nr:hypothetical protein LEP1GSC035_3246 [Leptospira noguchii str. 2007001578]EMO27470.1 hypothetical protein LEP1GSC170_1393 [Leptospira interrogans serovar Bataviae str. HAI135]EMO89810.1 hypothetical protein LEP1GSC024_2150 [Leptospira noguchii str. 2001034031]EPE84518.1 hypothetical protein LEP1GSC021_1268 [Leptospira noguchii str. 1993005606]
MIKKPIGSRTIFLLFSSWFLFYCDSSFILADHIKQSLFRNF